MIETRLRSYTVGSSGNVRLVLCGHPLQKLTQADIDDLVITFNPSRLDPNVPLHG
jgi:hypothetical protein